MNQRSLLYILWLPVLRPPDPRLWTKLLPKKSVNRAQIKNETVNIHALCLQSTAKVFKKTLANADEK